MCHNQFGLLNKLLHVLDEDWIDIYIHVDKRADFPSDLNNVLNYANLYSLPRINVNWGGYSQIKVELLLLQEAVKTPHQYYHLISGVDFPLKSLEDIRTFFNENNGEYIRYNKDACEKKDFLYRKKYYYFFQDIIGRNKGIHIALLEEFEKLSLYVQKALKVNRLKGKEYDFYKGSNWFSITHEMAEWTVCQKKTIEKSLKFTHCADEIMMQTLAMMSPYLDNIVYDNMRMIDWKRGNPYTFTIDDYDELVEGDRLWARKFDYENEPEVVDRIEQYLRI